VAQGVRSWFVDDRVMLRAAFKNTNAAARRSGARHRGHCDGNKSVTAQEPSARSWNKLTRACGAALARSRVPHRVRRRQYYDAAVSECRFDDQAIADERARLADVMGVYRAPGTFLHQPQIVFMSGCEAGAAASRPCTSRPFSIAPRAGWDSRTVGSHHETMPNSAPKGSPPPNGRAVDELSEQRNSRAYGNTNTLVLRHAFEDAGRAAAIFASASQLPWLR